MSLRLRFALAFFLLSALPLAGFSVYSYANSRAALRAAAESEAELAARELEQRLALASLEVDRRVHVLEKVPLDTWVHKLPGGEAIVAPALADLQEALPFLERLEFVAAPDPSEPMAPPTPAAPAAPVPPVPVVPAIPPAAAAPPGAESARADSLALELERIQAEVRAATAEADRARQGTSEDWERLRRRMEALRREAAERERRAARAEAKSAKAKAPAAAVAVELSDNGRVVGHLKAQIETRSLFRSVLADLDHSAGEIPFAITPEGALESPSSEASSRLEEIPALRTLREETAAKPPGAGVRAAGNASVVSDDEWLVVARRDATTGYRIGIARPLSSALARLKVAAARNFVLGLGLVGLALVAFVPMSGRIVRDVATLERGAARLAAGDLATRVSVRGRDEVARLGDAFNRMAVQLSRHQEQLLEQERQRKEDELARRLVAVENERRGRELEEARQFQLSLLPRELPRRPGLEIAASTTPATEVGGDYYDFLECGDGSLLVAVGDATGHGAAAGTLVTAVKALFAGGAERSTPSGFLGEANAAIHRMGLVRRAMALTLGRLEGRRLRLSAAGMPPTLHYRAAEARITEVALAGTPLGARAASSYEEARIELAAGDALLLLSDGLPELPNADGEPFGYERLARRFAGLAAEHADAIVAGLEAEVEAWGGDAAPADDVTFLVLRVTA